MNRNPNRGGVAQYIREDIPSRQISFKNDDEDIAHFCWNQPLKEKNGSCWYNSHLQFIGKNLTHTEKALDRLSSKYDGYILMSDLNVELSNNFLDKFTI